GRGLVAEQRRRGYMESHLRPAVQQRPARDGRSRGPGHDLRNDIRRLRLARAGRRVALEEQPAESSTRLRRRDLFRSAAAMTGTSMLMTDPQITSPIWHDAQQWGVEGKGWTDTARYYDRLPARA